jgi:hypothetical protein
MRASLLHPIDARHARGRRGRGGTPGHRQDSAAQQVREAGGPTDLASYSCQCGYMFAAAVSTTVECPHCGSPQAW